MSKLSGSVAELTPLPETIDSVTRVEAAAQASAATSAASAAAAIVTAAVLAERLEQSRLEVRSFIAALHTSHVA
jgi:hypothetical protein